MAAIAIAELSHRYGSRQALQSVSLTIPQGEIHGLLGPNGGGKSTLLRILSTLLPVQSGQVQVCEHDVMTHPDAVRSRIGVTFQSPSLDIKLSVEENLRYQGHLYGLFGTRLRERMSQMMEALNIADRAQDIVQTLSGGLKRRVEIAKTLLHLPQLLLLDEPSTGLDPGARHDLWTRLTTLRNETGLTVLVTTHLMEEAERCDRLGLLDHGQLIAEGTPDQLRTQVGGDSLTIDAIDVDALQAKLRRELQLEAIRLGDQLRIENITGPDVIVRLSQAFPGEFRALTLGKPTLEDAFIRLTGRRLQDDETAGLTVTASHG
ncbi:MAG: ABC transporter ATP-binding protein [Planctomycetaceae bacterium]|nr:ABC transporter ATP-binding protein [Planctomycetaceae bacterium]